MDPAQIDDVLEVPTDQYVGAVDRGRGNMLSICQHRRSDDSGSNVEVRQIARLLPNLDSFDMLAWERAHELADTVRCTLELQSGQIGQDQQVVTYPEPFEEPPGKCGSAKTQKMGRGLMGFISFATGSCMLWIPVIGWVLAPILFVVAVVLWISALLPSSKISFRCQSCKEWFTVPREELANGGQ